MKKIFILTQSLFFLISFSVATLYSAEKTNESSFGSVSSIKTNSAKVIDASSKSNTIIVHPAEYAHALRNPMKGFRVDTTSKAYQKEFVTISRCYIKWNELENDEKDTIDKIRKFCDKKWKDLEKQNIKVIPRVYLDWNRKPGNEYWPADMQTGDYESEQFKKRLVRLIDRLGKCWDNDSRVAWIQMGLIGCWGEHHTPSLTPEMQKLLGDAFTKAFKNKKILVRHADEFTDYEFGIYWDSWAHEQQTNARKHGRDLDILNKTKERWKTAPIEGETAYDWGKFKIQPGDDPNDTLTDQVHRNFLIDTIRKFHCSGLGWIANYDNSKEEVRKGADEVQKAFGYRFVLNEFTCVRRIDFGKPFSISFSVINTGSAPVYENRPIEFSLLDPQTRKPVWKTILNPGVLANRTGSVPKPFDLMKSYTSSQNDPTTGPEPDLRNWLPGDDWDPVVRKYRKPAPVNVVKANLILHHSYNAKISKGNYIAALAVLDPVGLEPNLVFAIENYFNGGRHPLCQVAIGSDPQGNGLLKKNDFDDPMKDRRLPYTLTPISGK